MSQECGKTKYEIAMEIANKFGLDRHCKEEAQFVKKQSNSMTFLVPENLEHLDKALDLYLKRFKKIMDALS